MSENNVIKMAFTVQASIFGAVMRDAGVSVPSKSCHI